MRRALGSWLAFALSALAVLAVAVAIQSWAEVVSPRFDLTLKQELTLTPFAREILKQVKGPLQIEIFHRRDDRTDTGDLATLFADACPNLEISLVDLDHQPQRARDAGVTRYGEALLQYEGRRLVAPIATETFFATAILRVVSEQDRVLYFISGHGERSPTYSRAEQFGEAGQALRNEGFVLRTLPLLQARAVPADAAAVILAGPEVDPVEAELDALDDYLEAGGAVLALVDPAALPHLERWIGSHDILLGDDVVIDRVNRIYGSDGTNVLVPQWRDHPMFKDHNTPAVFGRARGVEPAPGSRAEILARTAPESFLAQGAARSRDAEVVLDPLTDRSGPISVMALALGEAGANHTAGRLVVVGDVDFASDNYISLVGNRDLFLRTIDWLVKRGVSGSRGRGRDVDQRPISPVQVSERLSNVTLWGGAIAWPAVFLVVGILVTLQRRRRR